jgi:hypothetical protein
VPSAEAAEFILAGVDPEGPFTALAEFLIFGELASVRVEGVAVECEVVVEEIEEGIEGDDGGGVGEMFGSGAGTVGVARLGAARGASGSGGTAALVVALFAAGETGAIVVGGKGRERGGYGGRWCWVGMKGSRGKGHPQRWDRRCGHPQRWGSRGERRKR